MRSHLPTPASKEVLMAQTTIQYVLARLRDLGITDVFGVPGDYAFPLSDAICAQPDMRFIGSCNELNAAYAADGYARIKGMAAVNTTYGPGELSALSGIAGAYAEHLPIFHITGQPALAAQRQRSIVHHSLGNGDFDMFYQMTAPAVCARTVITAENCISETERLIAAALYHNRPVYMAFPSDVAYQDCIGSTQPHTVPTRDPAALESAVDAIVNALENAKQACILPGILLARLGLQSDAQEVVEKSGLPFATMMMDKTVLDETHPQYIGMYAGALAEEDVREFVESCDCILNLGTLPSDFNMGAFTAKLTPNTVSVMHHRTRVGNVMYENVEIKDVLLELAKRLQHRTDIRGPRPSAFGEPEGHGEDRITAMALYPRWSRFLQKDDIVISESGTNALGMSFARMPKGVSFHNQTLWGAIGWATPAAFGAALAAPDRRVVLITGEGAHQMTAQEISQFHRFGLKPIVFVLNNNGYLIERLLCKYQDVYYNDLPQWNYAHLPKALGCDGWFSARVTNCAELDAALALAENTRDGAYIEIVTDKYVAPPAAVRMHESTKSLYKIGK